jgi:hypothetical protein
MVRWSAIVCVVVWISPVLGTDAHVRVHIRALDVWADESLQRGLSYSATVRELIRELDRTDIIVHLDSAPHLAGGLAGMTRFVGIAATTRYVRITLLRDLPPDTRASTLAHELQHVIELARSDARSHAAVRALFERIGVRVDAKRRFYETGEAQRAGARAWIELRRQCAAIQCSRP